MDKSLALLFLLLHLLCFSQPGERDFLNRRIQEIETIGTTLAKEPTNYQLIWQRTELIFSPYFSMYSVPAKPAENDTAAVGRAFYELSALKYKDIDILGELNNLIGHVDTLAGNASDRKKLAYVNKSNFYYKRGQYHYLKNDLKKALDDYLAAWKYNPDDNTRTRICVAIAAYYYHLGAHSEAKSSTSESRANLEKALEFIDLISPQYDKTVISLSPDIHMDYQVAFEREKLDLLEMTGQRSRLANFHINKTRSLFNLYNKLTAAQKPGQLPSFDECKRILEFAVQSLSEAQKYIVPRQIDFLVGP